MKQWRCKEWKIFIEGVAPKIRDVQMQFSHQININKTYSIKVIFNEPNTA